MVPNSGHDSPCQIPPPTSRTVTGTFPHGSRLLNPKEPLGSTCSPRCQKLADSADGSGGMGVVEVIAI
jgi:hypothetical protein